MGKFVDTGLLLAGDVYISEILSAGVYAPASGPINVSQLQLTPPTTEEKSRASNKKESFGQTLDAVQVPKDPAKVSIKWDTASKALLADAVAGKAESFATTAKTVTDELVTLSADGYLELASQNIDATGWSVKKASDSTPLEEGTDYEVKRDLGLIMALTEEAAVAVKVSYKTKVVSGTKVSGATEITKPRRILVDGVNLATNERVRVVIEHGVFTAKGATDLMKGDFIEGELEGTLVTPAGKTAPWTIEVFDVA